MINDPALKSLQNEEIMITGGCGFIGSEITRQLSDLGANVTILDNLSSGKEEYVNKFKNVIIVKGDMQNRDLVSSAVKNKSYIINLAALPFIPDSYYHPMHFFDVNVNATISLALEVIKENKAKRLVHVSSSEVYGTARFTPMDENHPTIPQSTYAVSKLAGERVINTMSKEHNLPAVIIRPFNSFGPNVTQPYIIPEIINQILQGKNDIHLGNINSKRDLTFVSDTARAILLSLVCEGIVGETLNIGSERSFSIKDLVKIIAEIMGRNISIKIDPSRFRPHDVETLVCDYGRASRLLDWKPLISIRDGLEKTITWAKQNGVSLSQPFKGWTSSYRASFRNEPN